MLLDETISFGNFVDFKEEIKKFNNYYYIEKHEFIGSGSWGEVWRGFRVTPYDYEEIAIKVSNREYNSLASLKKESNLAKALKIHDGIGKIIAYDFDQESNRGQVLMEYIPGKDLSNIINWHKKLKINFPQRLAAFIGFECSKNLDYAHKTIINNDGKTSLGLIHRDVTPQNIIITKTGHPKIIDFGLGILSSDVGNKEILGQIAGKLGFIAPEMFNNKSIDSRVDIYSLGMVIDYMIRGRNPILDDIDKNSDRSAVLNQTIKNMRIGIKSLKEEIGSEEELSNIISKAVENNLDNRYNSMEELHEDFKKYLYFNGPTRLGPTREAFQNYIELIYTPGLNSNLSLIISGKTCHLHDELKRKINIMKEQAPYMVKEGKFCLEILLENKIKNIPIENFV